MPAEARGRARKLPSGRWQLRHGTRAYGVFGSKTEAMKHRRDVVEPELNGRQSARRDMTFGELCDVFLERHATTAKPRTIQTLRERLVRSRETFGIVPLLELEGMTDEIAAFAVSLPDRYRYSVVSAFRQTLEAAPVTAT